MATAGDGPTKADRVKPLCIDLFCGLGGWTEGFLAEGYQVIGFDIERHVYRTKCQECDGTGNVYRHDEDGDFLPCDCYHGYDHYGTVETKYPGELVLQDVLTLDGRQFRNADVIVASPPCQAYSYRAMPWKRAKALPPPSNELFDACFRIASEAGVPLIVENVKGAQPWVGRAKWHYGSFYLWGDVPALMPSTRSLKVAAVRNCDEGTKHGGDWFSGYGGGFGSDHSQMRQHSSKSQARKQASALIAKIPFEMSSYIARVFKPS